MSEPSSPRRLAAQIDLDGDLHEIAPQTERMRLFEPAPTQLAGQQSMTIEPDRGADTMSATENIHAGAEERATQRVSWWVAGNYGDGEATCRRWEAMTAEAFEEITVEEYDRDSVIYNLGNALKDWLTEEGLSEEVQTDLAGDLIGYMVACVDFQQIARDAIEQREIEAR